MKALKDVDMFLNDNYLVLMVLYNHKQEINNHVFTAITQAEIAEELDYSLMKINGIISKLKKANLVKSIRGAQGGYMLARDMTEISVGDILRALEGDLAPVECISNQESSCESANLCVTKLVWQRINDGINNAVDTLMLSELVEQSKKLNPYKLNLDKNKC